MLSTTVYSSSLYIFNDDHVQCYGNLFDTFNDILCTKRYKMVYRSVAPTHIKISSSYQYPMNSVVDFGQRFSKDLFNIFFIIMDEH